MYVSAKGADVGTLCSTWNISTRRLPGEEDALLGGWEGEGGAGSGGQQGQGAVGLGFADEQGEASAGGDEAGGGEQGLFEVLDRAHGDQAGVAAGAIRRGR